MTRNYGSIYDQTIVRDVLPISHDLISKGTNKIVQISDGWISKNGFLELEALDNDEKRYIIGRIHNTEDHAFIYGNSDFDIVGINKTNTIRHDLLNAIKEFDAKYIITGSKYLNPPGIKVFRWPQLATGTHYLIPSGITNEVAEFIISEDIKEDFSDYHYKQFWHDVHEWIGIRIYNPDFFVKVCKK